MIGAGHAGLAMSRCLAERSIDHVVLERGEVANTWRNERWDSLRLLTPNWQSRLPGFGYRGDNPDGYRTVPEVIRFIEDYARAISAPVETGTRVTSVRSTDAGYLVRTDRGDWECKAVVLASGACNIPEIPALRRVRCRHRSPASRPSSTAIPASLPTAASWWWAHRRAARRSPTRSSARAARSICRSANTSGRRASIAARTSNGGWTPPACKTSAMTPSTTLSRARRVPSLQLAGTPDRSTLDLNALTDIGVTLVGRLAGIANDKAQFAGSLRNMCAMSDLKMGRLLEAFDVWARDNGVDGAVEPPHRLPPTRVEDSPPLSLSLAAGTIKTIIWATGYRPDYSWLELPVLDRKGMVRHDGGVADLPGLYLMGLHFMRRRKSTLIDGAADDARELSDHLALFLDGAIAKAGEPQRIRSPLPAVAK